MALFNTLGRLNTETYISPNNMRNISGNGSNPLHNTLEISIYKCANMPRLAVETLLDFRLHPSLIRKACQ